jgi:tetratricopeptide (TPR) repeat protein
MGDLFLHTKPVAISKYARYLLIFFAAGTILSLCFSVPKARAADSIQVLAARAEKLEAEGEWQQAAAVYKSILKLNPKSLAALNRLGTLYVHHQKSEEGIKYYKRAIEVSPNEYVTNLNLGIAYFKMSNYPSAVGPLKKASEAQPSSFQARELLSVALIGTGNYEAAIPELEKAKEIEPQDVSTQYLLVRSYMAKKEFNKALNVFNSLESLAPQSLWVHILKGQAYEGLGDYQKALTALNAAREQAPRDAIVRFSLGFIYWKTNRFSEAEAEFVHALKLDPDFETARFYLADCYLKEQKPGNALPLLKEVVNKQPRNFWAHLDLGKALSSTGSYEDAAQEFQAANRLQPDDSEPHYLLGRTYQKLKQMDAYKRELQIAQKLQSRKLAKIENLMNASGARGNPARELGVAGHSK